MPQTPKGFSILLLLLLASENEPSLLLPSSLVLSHPHPCVHVADGDGHLDGVSFQAGQCVVRVQTSEGQLGCPWVMWVQKNPPKQDFLTVTM